MSFYEFWRAKRVTTIGRRWSRQAADHTLARVAQLVSPLERVVEIGPGRGAFAAACAERGLRYAAVDANAGLLHEIPASDGLCAFVPPLPVRDATCDAVVANHVLEHCAGLPQAQAFLGDMRRIVRPGGCVAITSPDLLWYKQFFWDCDYSHNFATSSRRLTQMFLDQGLEIVRLEYVHNHLTGWRGYVAGKTAQLVPYRVLSAQPTSALYIDHIYKARLTFARAVLIIGRRPVEAA